MSKKNLNDWGRKELINLPVREWNMESEYDSILLLSTRKKHDSGWAMIAVIGVINGLPVEIACNCCDDIEWKFPPMKTYGDGFCSVGQVRMDCAIRSSAMHAWVYGGRFRVGVALSSTTIELIKAREQQ